MIGKTKHIWADHTRKAIWARDGAFCVYCGHPAMVIDHVIPFAEGGPNIKSNGVVCCRSCNNKKKDLLVQDMLTAAILHLMCKGEDVRWMDDFAVHRRA